MSNTFSTKQLAGHRVLVTGVDDRNENRHAILDSSEWDSLRHDQDADAAAAEFDRATKAFYAPLTEAAERLERKQLPKLDPAFTYLVTEGEAGTPGVEEHIIELTRDSVTLRLLEQGNTDRLVWVGDTIEVLAPTAPVTGDDTGVLAAEPVLTDGGVFASPVETTQA